MLTTPRRLGGDGGAVLVEFAAMAPILLLLVMGIGEFGLAWRDTLSLESATRGSARIAANTNAGGGNAAGADKLALQSLLAAMGRLDLTKIDRVIVYNASSSTGTPPTACVTTTSFTSGYYGPTSGSDKCNVYTGAGLQRLKTTNFSAWSSAWESHWAPSTRSLPTLGDPTTGDFLGVYIKFNHDYITGFFGNGVKLTDHAVVRIEPKVI